MNNIDEKLITICYDHELVKKDELYDYAKGYFCTCNDVLFIKYHTTEVDEEGLCVKCGHYAIDGISLKHKKDRKMTKKSLQIKN